MREMWKDTMFYINIRKLNKMFSSLSQFLFLNKEHSEHSDLSKSWLESSSLEFSDFVTMSIITIQN